MVGEAKSQALQESSTLRCLSQFSCGPGREQSASLSLAQPHLQGRRSTWGPAVRETPSPHSPQRLLAERLSAGDMLGDSGRSRGSRRQGSGSESHRSSTSLSTLGPWACRQNLLPQARRGTWQGVGGVRPPPGRLAPRVTMQYCGFYPGQGPKSQNSRASKPWGAQATQEPVCQAW